eukprot:TRINITY_DN21068_c0_g1_i1.p2 TRINITY_DN21068_c0_g1~~TRINITY_DN21068_c0_g1_i1.p2  ORF type:complete len:289 (+),score=42.82 TRINITY_DN21068_c0_g1_i1:57-869(+)
MQISGQKKKKAASKKPTVKPPVGMGGMGQAEGSPSIAFCSRKGTVEKIQDGIVVLREAIGLPMQQKLLDECFVKGAAPEGTQARGFYEAPSEPGGKLVLNQGNRGRIIHPIADFTEIFREECLRCLEIAMKEDKTLPPMDPSTVLVNFYNQKGNFKWHKDSEDPTLIAKQQGKPIISFTIGESCTFGIRDSYEQETPLLVKLNSGDVIVFGGPSRMIVHSVIAIHSNTKPPSIRFPFQQGRLNITFRDVGGTIDTSQFPAYRVVYDIEEK